MAMVDWLKKTASEVSNAVFDSGLMPGIHQTTGLQDMAKNLIGAKDVTKWADFQAQHGAYNQMLRSHAGRYAMYGAGAGAAYGAMDDRVGIGKGALYGAIGGGALGYAGARYATKEIGDEFSNISKALRDSDTALGKSWNDFNKGMNADKKKAYSEAYKKSLNGLKPAGKENPYTNL
jgi:hypothetical protein